VRARAAAHGYRLAHVERLATLVPEDVDAGVIGELAEVRALLARHPHPRLLGAAEARAGELQGVADGGGMSAEAREQRAEHACARLGIHQRAVRGLHLDAERLRQRPQLALPRQRREPCGQPDGAHEGRLVPVHTGALERLTKGPAVEARVVGDEHPVARQLRELLEHLVGRRGGVHHGLTDPGEALDAARQRLLDPHERLKAVVQLAAAHEHGADLGDLAQIARAAVGLHVDGEELGGGQRLRTE